MPQRIRDKTRKLLPKTPIYTRNQPLSTNCEPPALSMGNFEALFGEQSRIFDELLEGEKHSHPTNIIAEDKQQSVRLSHKRNIWRG